MSPEPGSPRLIADDAPRDALTKALSDYGAEYALLQGGLLLAFGLVMVIFTGRRLFPDPPQPARPGPPVMLMGFTFLALFIGTLGGGIFLDALPEDHILRERKLLGRFVGLTIANALPLFVLVSAVRTRFIRWPDVGLTRPDAGPHPAVAAGALYLSVLPAFFGAVAVEHGMYRFFGQEPPSQSTVQSILSDTAYHNALVVAFVAGAIPFFEEVLFRGVLLSTLLSRIGQWRAIFISSLAFTMMHDAGMLPVFVLGCTLGWLYCQTRSILAPLLFHGLHNLLVLLVLFATGGSPS